jgi:hypothetical protein
MLINYFMRKIFMNKKIKGIKILLCLVFFISCINKKSGSDNQTNSSSVAEKIKTSVSLTFLDGTKLKIDELKFQYGWMYEDDKKYLNPPTYSTESFDIHYCEINHGIENDIIIKRDSISSIIFDWPKDINDGDYRSPNIIKVILKNGLVKEIKTNEYKLASKFLINGSNDKRLLQFNQLDLIGFAIINGQKERFLSSISMFGAIKVKKTESVKEISF